MATFRVGVGSFNIQDGAVGFGTDTDGLGNLKVKGVTKTTDIKVSGASTLTRYSGFAADELVINDNTTLSGELSSFGDIVVNVGAALTVGLGTTVTVGTVESVSIGTHFSPPTGGIEERGQDFIEGMMRFNTDLNTMEFYNGNEWRQFTYISDVQNSPSRSGRGYVCGGYFSSPTPTVISDIQIVNVNSLGNSVHFGDTSSPASYLNTSACSSSTRAIIAGTGSYNNIMEYFTMATQGDTVDYGDLTGTYGYTSATSSSTRGLTLGAYHHPSPSAPADIIDYYEIATIGNALDFGNLPNAVYNLGAFSSPVRGICFGGAPSAVNTVSTSVKFASLGSAVDFGTISQQGNSRGSSNSVRGIMFISGPAPHRRNIDHLTIASEGNSVVFGEMTLGRQEGSCFGNHTRVCYAGGLTPTMYNTIEFVTISTAGNAQDFGDLTGGGGTNAASSGHGGVSDSHGGLGGY